jgi:hypothetical protein
LIAGIQSAISLDVFRNGHVQLSPKALAGGLSPIACRYFRIGAQRGLGHRDIQPRAGDRRRRLHPFHSDNHGDVTIYGIKNMSTPAEDKIVWMVATEDVDGVWFRDPKVFRGEMAARKWAAETTPPDGYSYLLYSCTYIEDLRDG